MADDLSKEQLKPEHPDRKTGYERILTDPAPPWFVELYPGGDGTGFLQKLDRHSILFHQRSAKRLVVSFDNIANANDLSFRARALGVEVLSGRRVVAYGGFCPHQGVVSRSRNSVLL